MSEFFNMGGYAVYVWSSYLFVSVLLLGCYLLPQRKARALLKKPKQTKSEG